MYRILLSALSALFFLTACSRSGDLTPPDPAPDTTINGVFYHTIFDPNQTTSIRKSTGDNATPVWTTRAGSNLYGDNFLLYDSGVLYYGSSLFIQSYNASTGTLRWSRNWSGISSDAQPGRPLLRDSLLYITSSSDPGSFFGKLHCVSKANGNIRWTAVLDQVGYINNGKMTSAPLGWNDKIITVVRDAQGRRHLGAFNAATGQPAWTSAINDSLDYRIYRVNNRIYSTSSRKAYCYSADDGSLLWQVNLPLFSQPLVRSYEFVEGSKVLLTRVSGFFASTLEVCSLDLSSGALSAVQTLSPGNGHVRGVGYHNNTFYIGSDRSDTMTLSAYNASTLALNWTVKGLYDETVDVDPVVTNDNVIFASTWLDFINNQTKSYFYVLNLQGGLVRKLPVDQPSGGGLVFVTNNTPFYRAYSFIP